MRMRGLTFLVAVVATAGLAVATTVIPMSIEDLVRGSTAVVEGTAGQSWSQWNPEHTIISTYTRFRVLRSLKGAAVQDVLVKQMGGSAGGYQQKVAGVRMFRAGDAAVLFLRPSVANDGTMVITGLMQGNFRIESSRSGEATVTNGVPAVESFQPGAPATSAYTGSRMTLRQLETRVLQAVGR